jgi:hypothetical protein
LKLIRRGIYNNRVKKQVLLNRETIKGERIHHSTVVELDLARAVGFLHRLNHGLEVIQELGFGFISLQLGTRRGEERKKRRKGNRGVGTEERRSTDKRQPRETRRQGQA